MAVMLMIFDPVPGHVRHVVPEGEDDLEPPVVDVEADVLAVVVDELHESPGDLSLHRQG